MKKDKFSRVKKFEKKLMRKGSRRASKAIAGQAKGKRIWKDSWEYLKESANYVYLAVGLFFISALVAFLIPSAFSFFNDVVKDLVDKTYGLNTWELIWFIFRNNVASAFSAMIFGVVLGLFPFFNALTNGALLGYVISRVSDSAGIAVIWRILPHGIFELPAIFISMGIGMKFGMFVFAKKRKKEFFRRFYSSMKVFLSIVLPLLIVAAVIEGFLISLF